MKVFALAALAAGLLVVPASAQTVNSDAIRLAQADVSVRIGGPGHGHGVAVGHRRHHHFRHHHADCRTVVIKERRGNTVITKRIKRC